MSKIIIFIIIIAILIVAIVFLIPKQEKREEMPQEQEKISYAGAKGEFTIYLPKNWEGYYKAENKDCEEATCTILSYKAVDEMDAMILIINAYPSSTSIFALKSMPNTKIIAQTMDTIFTMSQALDIPYMEGTSNFNKYVEMVNQMDEVVASIKPTTEIYTLTQRIYETDDQGRLYIDVYYPEIKNEKDFSDINKTVKQEMEKFIAEFKKNFEEWGDMDAPEGAYSGFWIDYQLKSLNDDLASIYFVVSENLAGAAHPNNYSHSLNFDLKTNKKIKLDDLFKVKEKEYLSKISELAIADLTNQFRERNIPIDNTFETGTEPKEENYNNFNITSQGIVFNFDQYQLAAYAAGSFQVLILYDDLKDILEDKIPYN